ncbi:carbohydrate ABC transporter permease [Streptomyces sp. NPDC101455]|uniref:carbohydrate ABC transporter permease n=1 Tax=Streptomyces sp. NPDC101455 TaxID=3366142 RepID=UPI0038037C2E
MVTSTRTGVRRYAVAILVTAAYSLPLYLAIVNVFKKNTQITSDPMGLPAPFTLGNLVSVFTSPDDDLVGTLVRTLVITAVSMVGVVLLGSMLGYYLGRHQGPIQRLMTMTLLLGLAIPFQVILIPVTQVLKPLHLLNTYAGLVIFNVGYYIPFAVLVFSRFVREIPRELDEAAALDGAGPVRVFTRIIFPLMHPAMASVAIFVSVWVWNDFVNPLILLGPETGTTIMTGIYRSLGQFNSDFGTTFAFMFVASLPLLILFLALQKRFVSGLASGATKG